MNKITTFDKSSVKVTIDVIQSKLDELKEFGLDIQLKNTRYDADSFTSKIEVRLENAEDEFSKAWNHSFDSTMNKDITVGQTFDFNGKEHIFRGFKPRARTNHAIVEDAKGSLYRMDFERVKQLIQL